VDLRSAASGVRPEDGVGRCYLRLPRLRRARLRCFLPGGPSGEPAGVLLSPFGFGFAIVGSYAAGAPTVVRTPPRSSGAARMLRR